MKTLFVIFAAFKFFLSEKFYLVFNCTQNFINGYTKIGKQKIGPLKAVIDPEYKRQIIGDVFMECKDKAIQEVYILR